MQQKRNSFVVGFSCKSHIWNDLNQGLQQKRNSFVVVFFRKSHIWNDPNQGF